MSQKNERNQSRLTPGEEFHLKNEYNTIIRRTKDEGQQKIPDPQNHNPAKCCQISCPKNKINKMEWNLPVM